MINIVFPVAFICAPVVILYLLIAAGEVVNKISIVNVLAWSLYAFSIVGTLPLFYQIDPAFSHSNGVNNQAQVFKVFVISFFNIIVFLAAVIFSRRILRLKPAPIICSGINELNIRGYVFLISVFFFILYVLYLYLVTVERIAFFVVFDEGSASAAIARSAMGNSFSGKYHWYSLVMHDFVNLLTFSLFSAWLLNKNKYIFVFLMLSFLVSSFTAVMAIEKAPFVGLLMALVIVYYLTMHEGFIPKKVLFFLGFFVFIILVLFFNLFHGVEGFKSAVLAVISRAFAGSIEPAYYYLQYFPAEHEYLFGKSFPNPAGVFPYTPFRLGVEIMNWKNPGIINSGIVGSYPTVFWGEAYANYGFLGIPVISVLVGIFVSLVSFFTSKLVLNPLTIGFTVWMIFHFKNLSVTGFSGYFFDFYLLGVLILVFLFLYISRCGYFRGK